ncbi:inhibitor of growth protein 3 isoform X3 [Diabrotica undecimpunctata]|uniref:inhibitor of growth protein 3 isoform X3 n=1 Tax=Diabrotica undecimpunctata TaxID=50387 RepID=UPI003B64296A
MLYLEDYLEMIEHLPQELRDRFTDMREMDLTIHNNMDELEKRVKNFFSDCKRCPNDLPQSVEAEFQAIRKEYYKTLEEADEKVHLASQMYDLVDKYLRRLDSELHKFKCELEADNKGITEVLEKRSLELDTPNTTPNISSLQQKENRYDSTFRYSRPRAEKRRDSSVSIPAQLTEKRQTVTPVAPPPLVETRHATTSVQPIAPSSATTTTMSYNLGHNLGAGPAIAAAASQAIAATQQMQQGRRTASLKASYEAINTGVHGHEFGIGRELAGAAQTAIQAIQQDHANNKKKQKKWNSSSSSSTSTVTVVQPVVSTPVVIPPPESPTVDTNSQNAEVTDGEWTYDPNEPRYCLCNQVSYGDMVACDNEDCPSEWFHYPCVGITAPPKGKWYCPQCTASMKRRGGRKN